MKVYLSRKLFLNIIVTIVLIIALKCIIQYLYDNFPTKNIYEGFLNNQVIRNPQNLNKQNINNNSNNNRTNNNNLNDSNKSNNNKSQVIRNSENTKRQEILQSALSKIQIKKRNKGSNESEKSEEDLNIIFLDPSKAQDIMSDSDYLKYFKLVDFNTRDCSNISTCSEKYKKNTVAFMPNEKRAVELLIKTIISRVQKSKTMPKDNIQFMVSILKQNFKFIKSTHLIEGNMPHTRQDCIVFPIVWYQKLTKLYHKVDKVTEKKATGIENKAILEFGGTMLHELSHIFQRQNPATFNTFYNYRWYFIYADQIDLSDDIKQRIRLNPDGLETMWIWKYPSLNYGLWINAIFDSQNEKNLRNTKYVGIPVIKKKDYPLESYMTHVSYRILQGTPTESSKNSSNGRIPLRIRKDDKSYRIDDKISKPIHLSEIKEFNDFFQLKNNNYHPNEIMAEYFKFYTLYHLGLYDDDKVIKSEGMNRFIKFLNLILEFVE